MQPVLCPEAGGCRADRTDESDGRRADDPAEGVRTGRSPDRDEQDGASDEHPDRVAGRKPSQGPCGIARRRGRESHRYDGGDRDGEPSGGDGADSRPSALKGEEDAGELEDQRVAQEPRSEDRQRRPHLGDQGRVAARVDRREERRDRGRHGDEHRGTQQADREDSAGAHRDQVRVTLPVAGRGVLRQPREGRCRERDGEDRVGQDVDRLGVLEEVDRPRPTVVIGKLERHEHGHLLGDQTTETGDRKVSRSRPHSRREVERRPQLHPGPENRDDQGKAHGRDPGGGPPPQPRDGSGRQLAGVGAGGSDGEVTEGEIADDDDRAGGQRCGGRPPEPTLRLQHTGQDDADPVEDDLRSEHGDERHSKVDRLGRDHRIDCRAGPVQEADDRASEDGEHDGSRYQEGNSPGQQGGGDPVDIGSQSTRERCREERHDRSGQRAASDDLEQHVRKLVRGRIGRPGRAGTDAVRLRHPPPEAHHAAQQRDRGDECCRTRHAGRGTATCGPHRSLIGPCRATRPRVAHRHGVRGDPTSRARAERGSERSPP
ncbi:hypothetical protein GALL_347980 [mine drainage metagenome]|uniref:Uncharacterized protein n=1 Tax=mine drainage metagenome TaxID=410659 RepID=A0A1J5R5G9_9ZZZZ